MRKTKEAALGIYSGWVRVSFSPWPLSLVGANYGYLDTGDLGLGTLMSHVDGGDGVLEFLEGSDLLACGLYYFLIVFG